MTATAEPSPAVAAHARTVALEVTTPPEVDWSAARLWRVLVTHDGVPVSSFWVPTPGRLRRPEAFTRSLLADGLLSAEYWSAYERYRERMGLRARDTPRPRVSVVVCTHRRSEYLPGLLAAVGGLDPAPHEVIVVDNAPGELDSRELIEAAGARYVREDRKGLDHARTAGVRAATGELVAFTDDDCVPAARWLENLGEIFDDPSVAAVTGPAFAYELVSPAQVRFELEGGFSRGLRRRAWDWTSISPLDAGAVGAGANMTFRRDVLESIGDPFPSELDAGTPTESGGDMYAIYRVLAAGHRAVYDPGTYVFHRHRRDPAALHRAFWGYGVGLSAVMTKLLVEELELSAPHSWGWLWRQYRSMLLRRLAGTADPRSLRVSWDYLRGGFSGVQAWARARREIPPAPLAVRMEPAAPAIPAAPAVPAVPGEPAVSVVVPTVGRADALRRCLAALAPQAADVPLEVIVVDDSRDGALPDPAPDGIARIVRSGGGGAAAARNAGAAAARGSLLLFLDDDLVPAPGLVERHRTRHAAEGDGTIVIGYSPPAPREPGLCELAAALWWHEHFDLLGDTAELTFADMLSGNMSISRDAFAALGGFDEAVGRMRREDWLFGYRALRGGARLVYEREAVASHEYALPTLRRLRAAREEGHGDAVLLRLHPELGPALDAPYAAEGLRRRALLGVLSAVVPPALRSGLHGPRGARARAPARLVAAGLQDRPAGGLRRRAPRRPPSRRGGGEAEGRTPDRPPGRAQPAPRTGRVRDAVRPRGPGPPSVPDLAATRALEPARRPPRGRGRDERPAARRRAAAAGRAAGRPADRAARPGARRGHGAQVPQLPRAGAAGARDARAALDGARRRHREPRR